MLYDVEVFSCSVKFESNAHARSAFTYLGISTKLLSTLAAKHNMVIVSPILERDFRWVICPRQGFDMCLIVKF